MNARRNPRVCIFGPGLRAETERDSVAEEYEPGGGR